MKKYNEGYALPFVLVVSVVMCLIAVTVMSFSLKNLQVQQGSIQKMKAKYEASAKIEELLAVAESNGGTIKILEDSFSSAPIDENNIIRVASGAAYQKDEETIWVWAIAALELQLKDESIQASPFIEESGTEGILSIKACTSINYKWFEIVDTETKEQFMNGGYDPYAQEQEGGS